MRKLTTGSIVALALTLLACAATAQRQGRTQRPGPGADPRDFGPPPHPLMSALDADKDGTISTDEMEKADTALKTLDKNGDGKLNRDELRPRFGGPDGRGRRPRGARGDNRTSSIENPPMPNTETEKNILSVLDDLDRNQRRGMMNVPVEDGRLLRLLAEAIGAKHVVEIGTSNGYSGIWLCLALRATGGRLTTYEIDADRAALARKNFNQAGVDQIVTLVEGDAHTEVTKLKGPIDILFLDADKQGYIDYLNKLLPLVRPGGLILAHNVASHGQAMKDYIKTVTTRAELETLFLHMDAAGVSMTLKKR